MKVSYQYPSPSMCLRQDGHTTLGLSPDLSREEQVSFRGKVKRPLVFRDAMLMLREIVVSDAAPQKKERVEFFEWLDGEIDRRAQEHEKSMPGLREDLQAQMGGVLDDLAAKDREISALAKVRSDLQKEIERYDAWKDYYKIERKFWQFIKSRDLNLWFVLDPVITVHENQVSFEAFSVDESIYGCLSVDMDEFELLQSPKLGTTNIDFSAKLATEMQRFRTYSDVELSVNPDGFAVDTGVLPEHVEKKIELPETWIKGFNQVSSAATLGGITVDISSVDMYDICSFLRRHKAHKSPRYMKWVFEPGKPIRVLFEPFGTELVLQSVYTGSKSREEKIWGRRRWLVMEKLLPLAESFQIKLLGFGMPQFVTADLGGMRMTIGLSSWSSNDWVKGTSFNIMSGFIGDGNYEDVYALLKEKRAMTVDEIRLTLKDASKSETVSGIGSLLKRGEGYFDAVDGCVRFRQLCNTPIPKELYETTQLELDVQKLLDSTLGHFRLTVNGANEYTFTNQYEIPNPKFRSYRGESENNPRTLLTDTKLVLNTDGDIVRVDCTCRDFQKGPRNISAPCSHVLALYVVASKFAKYQFEQNREYKINDIMEVLL